MHEGSPEPDPTRELLERWYEQDDAQALDELLRENLPWLKKRARGRLGAIRVKEGTEDVLNYAVVDFLRHGPRFLPANRAQFRALLGRIVDNAAHDRRAWFQAACRDMRREQKPSSDTTVDLARQIGTGTTPSQAASRLEAKARVRLALELLTPEDRDVVAMRSLRGMTFPEIASELGLPADTLRMRYSRAIRKLSQRARELQRGEVRELED